MQLANINTRFVALPFDIRTELTVTVLPLAKIPFVWVNNIEDILRSINLPRFELHDLQQGMHHMLAMCQSVQLGCYIIVLPHRCYNIYRMHSEP
jgi:hypothetical protein